MMSKDDKTMWVEYDPTFSKPGANCECTQFYGEGDHSYIEERFSSYNPPSACLMRVPDAPAQSVYDDGDHSHIEGLIK